MSIKDDIWYFQNIGCILDKNEQDGNVQIIGRTFESIFQKEIVYAVSGELKRTEKIESKESINRS